MKNYLQPHEKKFLKSSNYHLLTTREFAKMFENEANMFKFFTKIYDNAKVLIHYA